MADWTGDPDELLTLDAAAALIPGADADALKRLIRNGKLRTLSPWQEISDDARRRAVSGRNDARRFGAEAHGVASGANVFATAQV